MPDSRSAAGFLLPGLAVLALVVRSVGRPARGGVARTQAKCSDPTESKASAGSRLVRATHWRAAGALLGFLVSAAVVWFAGTDHGWGLPLILIGYFAGGLVAGVAYVTTPTGSTRSALLVERRLTNYLPAPLVASQRWLGVTTVAVALLYALWPHTLSASYLPSQLTSIGGVGRWLPSSLGLVPFGVLGLLIYVFSEWLERRIVERSQPYVAIDRVTTDDAIRARSVIVVAATGVGLLIALLSFEILVSAASLSSNAWLLRDSIAGISILLWVAAPVACFLLGEQLNSRRSSPDAGAA